jgi:hypothetical protein
MEPVAPTKAIVAGVAVASLLALANVAHAAVRLLQCEGTGIGASMEILPSKEFFFKFDDTSEQVVWAVGDGVTKITIDHSLTNAHRLIFYAETAYKGSNNLKYSFAVNRDTGHAEINFFELRPDGSIGAHRESYSSTCRAVEPVF